MVSGDEYNTGVAIMISKSIEKGTMVWHEAFGSGRFIRFTHRDIYNEFAYVQFKDETHIINRKRLTEDIKASQRVYQCNSCKYERTTNNVLISGIQCEKCHHGRFEFIKKIKK